MGNALRMFDDRILSTVCEGLAPDDDLDFIDIMRKELLEAPSANVVAAPQVGVARCAAIVSPNRNEPPIVMLNPVILTRDASVSTDIESCLSYPDSSFPIDRHSSVTCRYFDEDWNLREKRFSALSARLIQHAVGHLQGTCAVGQAWRLEKSVK